MTTLRDYLNYHLDVDGRIECFQNGKQYSCEIEVTNRCNLTCAYCYASANSDKSDLLSLHGMRLIKELILYGIKEIGWIGGEPLLFDDLWSYVSMGAAVGVKQALYTNAVVMDKHLDLIRKYIDRVIVHVDSIDYGVWAKGQLKPSQESHRRMVKNIVDLAESGFPPDRIIVSIPLTRDCYESLEETMAWIVGLGVEFINLIPLTSIGRSNDATKFITPSEVRIAMRMRARMLDRPYLMELGISEYCKQFQLTDFTVNYKGDVLRYIDDLRPLGNVSDHGIISIAGEHSDELRLVEWVTGDTRGNKIRICDKCQNKEYCFGNPVSRPNPVVGEPDTDCWFVS